MSGSRPFRDNPRLILVGIAILAAALVAIIVLADQSAQLFPDYSMVPGETITPSDVAFLDGGATPSGTIYAGEGDVLRLHQARDRFESDYTLHVLAAQQGNISRTAEILGVERSNLYRKMRGLGIGPIRTPEGNEED